MSEHRAASAARGTQAGAFDAGAFIAGGDRPVVPGVAAPTVRAGARTLAIIPAYNELRSIGHVVQETLHFVDAVLVVDDGSFDGTATEARLAGASVIVHPVNQGKGGALRTGLAHARALDPVPSVVLIDADGQHDPASIPLALEAVRDGADIVVGSRFLGTNNAPIYRLFGLHVLSAAAALGSGIRITDSQSGFRALSPRTVTGMRLREATFVIETEMQFAAARMGLVMAEIPIEIRYTGPARRSPVAHGVGVLARTIGLVAARRPARLPLLVATPFVAIGIGKTRSVRSSGPNPARRALRPSIAAQPPVAHSQVIRSDEHAA